MICQSNKIYGKSLKLFGIFIKIYNWAAILTLVSYVGNDYSTQNRFQVTVDVKSRERGDTIYVASTPILTRAGITLTGNSTTDPHGYDIKDLGKQLKKLGIPYLVEMSSYETEPFGRMEWLKNTQTERFCLSSYARPIIQYK